MLNAGLASKKQHGTRELLFVSFSRRRPAILTGRNKQPNGRSVSVRRDNLDLAAEALRATVHACKALPFNFLSYLQPFTVIAHRERNPSPFDGHFDAGPCAPRMSNNIVDGFLKNQEDVTAHFRTESQVSVSFRRVELEFDIAVREDVAGEASHATGQINQPVSLWIDRPDDVSHRSDRLARDGRD